MSDEALPRVRRHSERITRMEAAVERIGRELVAIHGIDGGNGKIGHLEEKIDESIDSMNNGFGRIETRLDKQDADTKMFTRWFIGQAIVVLLAVAGYIARM